ncbi:MAG: class I SAM-dependent methyltransferase [Bacteroidota bacterium]
MANILSEIRKKIGLYNLKNAFKKISDKIAGLPSSLPPNQLLDIAYSKDFSLIEPWQERTEIVEVLNILEKNPPKSVLEIGTANGGTLFLLTRMASKNASILSVDLPGGKFGGGYPEWKEPIYKSFAKKGQTVNLIRANSHDKETHSRVASFFKDKKVDFIFIDGDHTYEGVKQDFENYKEFLTDGALVMFHDIAAHPNPIYGVDKFWKEIKQEFEHKEFVKDWFDCGRGLGLLFYKKK